MVFLYFVLPVFVIWLLQHYHSFSLSNKWLAHVPACFAALDNWFWFFLFYFQSSIPDFTVTSSCTESSFSPSPGELIYYPQNSLNFHENCWGACNFMIYYYFYSCIWLHRKNIFSIAYGLHPPVIQKVDNAHQIYPLDSAVGFLNTYLSDSDVQTEDNAIQRINLCPVDNTLISLHTYIHTYMNFIKVSRYLA